MEEDADGLAEKFFDLLGVFSYLLAREYEIIRESMRHTYFHLSEIPHTRWEENEGSPFYYSKDRAE